ncbi:MAG: SRPBCC family protein [Actinomycetota bacterium]|nr:SRPBCC family protein [Actinomycetota bacterium]
MNTTTSNPVTVSAPEGLPFIEVTREFDHPVEKVFEAHRDPALYAAWVGPDGYETDLQEFDFTTGGRFRFIHKDAGQDEYAFRGVFHVVRENELAIQTFEYEGYPDVVALERLMLTRLDDDRTRLSIHSVYPSVEARDAMVSSGMEGGLTQGYAKLDSILDRI